MESREKVTKAIGEKPYEMLIGKIENGLIDKDQLKNMALLMEYGVHGVYMHYKEKDKSNIHIFQRMMDRWYKQQLYKDDIVPFDLLIEILENTDVALHELAHEMKKIKTTKKLIIGLPVNHPDIAINQQQQGATASRAFPTLQTGDTCASNAVGMAALEFIHDCGYDADLQKIIDALVRKVQPGYEAKNPDEFNMKTIKVEIFKGDDSQTSWEIDVEFRIQTQRAVPAINFALQTIPNPVNLDVKKMKMVVRWDNFDPSTNLLPQHGHHAIFAMDYDAENGNYCCVNSWGGHLRHPLIHHSRIYAVDYVSLVQK